MTGAILNISIEKITPPGRESLKETKVIPTWVYRAYDPALKQHVIVPAEWCATDTTANGSTPNPENACAKRLMIGRRCAGEVRVCL
jgi:hypothetical protein